MMVMTAKVNLKKIAIILAAAIGLILVTVLLLGRGNESTPTVSAGTVSDNDSRVQFLQDMGWDVTTSPAESGQVRIPDTSSQVYERYNALQKSQGYDLNQYAGKTVMRYVYRINNFPDATDPVYATILVYKNQIIGGDVTNTGPHGSVQGFKMLPQAKLPAATTPSSDTASDT